MSQAILIPVLAVLGLLALAVVAVVVMAVASPEATRRRVLAAFRRPARPARTPDAKHYYKPYWS
jgi:hypothetical protein